MLTSLFIFLFVSCVSGQYSERCNNNSVNSLSLKPASDGVEGRYEVEWCTTKAHTNWAFWDLILHYDDNRQRKDCQKMNTKIRMAMKRLRHSYSHIPTSGDLECTNICLTAYQDLIFNGTCYYVESGFKNNDGQSKEPDDNLFYIDNQFSKEHFTESKIYASAAKAGEKTEVTWYTGYIPITEYSMQLYPNNSYTPIDKGVLEDNCSSEPMHNQIRCEFDLPPECYALHLKLHAPWTAAAIFKRLIDHRFIFCVEKETNVPVEQNSASNVVMWAGSAAVVTVAAVLVLLGARSARLSALRRRVWDDWITRSEPQPSEKPVAAASRVLLIYARDCPPFARAVQVLATALRRAGCQVVDLFSSEAVAASAAAPGEWLRRLAADPSTRLLLLQSPAAAALYACHLRPSAELSAPLLGRSAVRRIPHPADGAAMLALRLLGDAAHQPLAYRKVYVASVEGLDVDLVPGVTPHRRYVLPAYAEVLLRDLAPGGPADSPPPTGGISDPVRDSFDPTRAPVDPPRGFDFSDAVRDITLALRDMHKYIRDNPDYLTNELLYI